MSFDLSDEFFKEMRHEMNTQDNYGNAHPTYVVQEYRRADYSGNLKFKAWMDVQNFFTEKAAAQYIRFEQRYFQGKTRIYTKSGRRNPEWVALRKLLKGNDDDR